MEAISVWVAVGVFAVLVHGEPSIRVQAADDMFESEAKCDERQAEVLERAKSPPAGVIVAGLGTRCVLVKVEAMKPTPTVREFTPQEKAGTAKGAL